MRDASIKKVTLQDIADELGLAKGTVSMALRGDNVIAEATVNRVRDAARELGYDAAANTMARRMSMHRHGMQIQNRVVGVIASQDSMNARYFQEQFLGIQSELATHAYGALLVTTAEHGSPEEIEMKYFEPLTRGEIDGLISISHPESVRQVKDIRASSGMVDRPVVSLIHATDGVSSVVCDEQTGAYDAVNALLGLGHRHVLRLATSHRDDVHTHRDEGMRRAFDERGLDSDTHCPLTGSSMDWMSPPQATECLNGRDPEGGALLDYLTAHPEITAIMCYNDSIAIHAYVTLKNAGIDVPGRVSIVGFDDTDPIYAANHVNFLSSVQLPLREAGAQAASLILEQIDSSSIETVERVLPCRFMQRGSVGPVNTGETT
jgi:LacI family transcriptional regulator